jgi:release factor glutamine methyltransferase
VSEPAERPDQAALPTIGEALRHGSGRLRALDLPSADLEAALLLGMATGVDRLGLVTRTATALADGQWAAFQALLARREQRMPLQYLTGKQEFMSLEFAVSPDVLIPRPETEHLVEAVLDLEEEAGTPAGDAPGRLVVDLGTGSGAIAVALASYVTSLRVIATEVSTAALALAQANAERHGLADRIAFRQGAGLAPISDLSGQIDYLVSNPPYIPSGDIADLEAEIRDWEPRLALDGGPDGLDLIRRLVSDGPGLLKPGGHLVVEVMAGQAPSVLELLGAGPWEAVRTVEDYGGHERVVIARRR